MIGVTPIAMKLVIRRLDSDGGKAMEVKQSGVGDTGKTSEATMWCCYF